MALDRWAYWSKVELDFSRPGKLGDHAYAEAFNGTLRRERLSAHWSTTIENAQRVPDAWRADHNNNRPHRTFRGNPRPVRGRRLLRAGAKPIAESAELLNQARGQLPLDHGAEVMSRCVDA